MVIQKMPLPKLEKNVAEENQNQMKNGSQATQPSVSVATLVPQSLMTTQQASSLYDGTSRDGADSGMLQCHLFLFRLNGYAILFVLYNYL